MAATSIKEVIEQLEGIIQESIEQKSRLGYFAALYKRVTVSVKEGIANGMFKDGKLMEELDVVFANRYLSAYNAFKTQGTPSESWQVAFEAAANPKPLVLQQLFVGMNAHISLDLGIAAFEVYGQDLQNHHEDFNTINKVLSSLVDTVQSELGTFWPAITFFDKLMGGHDEVLADFGMDIARDAAWKFARELEKADAAGQDLAKIESERDEKVARFGSKLVQPGKVLGLVVWFLKLFETGSIASQIKELNAPAKKK